MKATTEFQPGLKSVHESIRMHHETVLKAILSLQSLMCADIGVKKG